MVRESETHSFLQLSNCNLDCSGLSALGLSRQAELERAEEVFNAFCNALMAAQNRKVDSIFIVGNLWQTQSVNQLTIARVLDAFSQLGDLPVFLAPDTSVPVEAAKARGGRRWLAQGPKSTTTFKPAFCETRHASLLGAVTSVHRSEIS